MIRASMPTLHKKVCEAFHRVCMFVYMLQTFAVWLIAYDMVEGWLEHTLFTWCFRNSFFMMLTEFRLQFVPTVSYFFLLFKARRIQKS